MLLAPLGVAEAEARNDQLGVVAEAPGERAPQLVGRHLGEAAVMEDAVADAGRDQRRDQLAEAVDRGVRVKLAARELDPAAAVQLHPELVHERSLERALGAG